MTMNRQQLEAVITRQLGAQHCVPLCRHHDAGRRAILATIDDLDPARPADAECMRAAAAVLRRRATRETFLLGVLIRVLDRLAAKFETTGGTR